MAIESTHKYAFVEVKLQATLLNAVLIVPGMPYADCLLQNCFKILQCPRYLRCVIHSSSRKMFNYIHVCT